MEQRGKSPGAAAVFQIFLNPLPITVVSEGILGVSQCGRGYGGHGGHAGGGIGNAGCKQGAGAHVR